MFKRGLPGTRRFTTKRKAEIVMLINWCRRNAQTAVPVIMARHSLSPEELSEWSEECFGIIANLERRFSQARARNV